MNRAKVAILGTGRGMSFARNYHFQKDAEVVALCDVRESRLLQAARRFREEFGRELRTYTDYGQMLERERPDIVVVANEGTRHPPFVVQALEAGCAVQSEVPMSYSIQGMLDIIDAVERTGRPYMLAENCQYFGYMYVWKRYIEQGRLGEVVYAEAEYIHDCRNLHYMDEEGNCYSYEQAKAMGFKGIQRTWRSGIYSIQYITHSLGPLLWLIEDRATVLSCLSTGSRTEPEEGNSDVDVAILRTEKRRVVMKVACGHSVAHPTTLWYTLYGTKGSVETPRGTAELGAYWTEEENLKGWAGMPWATEHLGGPKEAITSGHGGADWFLVREFLDVVLYGKPNPIDVYRAVDYSLPGVLAVWSAQHDGESVRVPDFRDKGQRKLPEKLAEWDIRRSELEFRDVPRE